MMPAVTMPNLLVSKLIFLGKKNPEVQCATSTLCPNNYFINIRSVVHLISLLMALFSASEHCLELALFNHFKSVFGVN